MSKHTFTPGPWNTGTDEDAHIVYDDSLEVVADTTRDDADGDTEAANARLIAAAPLMLTAATALLDVIADTNPLTNDWDNAVQSMSDAIAKAAGSEVGHASQD